MFRSYDHLQAEIYIYIALYIALDGNPEPEVIHHSNSRAGAVEHFKNFKIKIPIVAYLCSPHRFCSNILIATENLHAGAPGVRVYMH
jgi:hypothetical protein